MCSFKYKFVVLIVEIDSIMIFCYCCIFFLKSALLGRRQFFANEIILKMMKIAFCFTSEDLFVLKIFKFLS